MAAGNSIFSVSCDSSLGLSLQSFPGPRSLSGVEVGTSGLCSSDEEDLTVFIEFQKGSQASSRVETCQSSFLLSCQRGVRFPVEAM